MFYQFSKNIEIIITNDNFNSKILIKIIAISGYFKIAITSSNFNFDFVLKSSLIVTIIIFLKN